MILFIHGILWKWAKDMYKTITELAKELSVSRQAIHQAIDKLLDKDKLDKKGNSFILNEQQQAIVRSDFNHDDNEPSSKTSKNISTDLIITLQEHNAFLIKELENKNKQINELHILLLKEKDTLKLTDHEETPSDEEPIEQEPKQRKWYDIFRRRK